MSGWEGFRNRGAVYFLRHGETDGHVPGLMKGLGEQPLSARGREQARAAGAWLRGKGITLALSSPLARARETAEAAAEAALIPAVVPTPLLAEFDAGIFTGLTPAQAEARYPAEYAGFTSRSWDAVPGAEQSDSLRRRAALLWEELGRRSEAGIGNILCVVHKGLFQWLMRAPFGGDRWMPLFEIDFCGLYRLTYDRENGREYFIWDILNFAPWK